MGTKKIILGTTGLAALLTLLALFTNADYSLVQNNYNMSLKPTISSGHIDILVLLFRYVNILVHLSVVVFFFYLIFGIAKWFASGKDKTKDRKARHYIFVGIISIVVALLALVIVKMVTPMSSYNTSCDLCIPGL